MSSGHGPFPCALIAQPPLKGLTGRTPDFLWISRDSSFLNPVFIEIEDPDKKWLTDKGKQHHDLTYALDQLREWKEWFNDPLHRRLFFEYYEVPRLFRIRAWQPIFVLIYGRQAEDRTKVPKLRAHLRDQDRLVIPFEHVKPDPDAKDFLCARNTNNEYEALSIPPTLELRPGYAEAWRIIKGKETAALRCEWATIERRNFLAERFPYWDAWAANGSLIDTGDKE